MRLEQIKPGALVYDTIFGMLYRISDQNNFSRPSIDEQYVTLDLVGRRGEVCRGYDSESVMELRKNYVLWCSKCDGTGWIHIDGGKAGQSLRCSDCEGEGLIR